MLPILSRLRWFIPIIGLDTHIGTSAKTVERVGLRGRAEAAPLIVRIIREGAWRRATKEPGGQSARRAKFGGGPHEIWSPTHLI